MSLARLVVSSVADDRYSLTDEQLDNLKLAVSEACVMAIDAQDAGDIGVIDVACAGSRDRIEVAVRAVGKSFGNGDETMSTNGSGAGDDHGSLSHGLGIPLISSLVDAVSIEQTDDGEHVNLVIHCAPHPER